jgi:hypothetical protein
MSERLASFSQGYSFPGVTPRAAGSSSISFIHPYLASFKVFAIHASDHFTRN